MIVTLTEVQEAAIAYALRAKRPNDHRIARKAGRMVREFCNTNSYTMAQTSACVRDMFDMLALERSCMGITTRGR